MSKIHHYLPLEEDQRIRQGSYLKCAPHETEASLSLKQKKMKYKQAINNNNKALKGKYKSKVEKRDTKNTNPQATDQPIDR